MAVAVRRASYADRPAIARFIEQAFGRNAPFKAAPRWDWQFVENPYVHRYDDELPIWIAADGDRVVGQIAVQMGRIDVEGTRYAAGWAVDIMILPEYRGRGLGHRLQDAVTNDLEILLALTMVPASRRLAERHDCVTLGEVHQLTRLVRLDAATVRHYLELLAVNRLARHAARAGCWLQLDRLLPWLLNPLLGLRDLRWRALRRPPAVEIVEVERFGSEVDDLWDRARRDYPVIVARDAQFLNWRYVDSPGLRYRRFLAQRAGRPVGFVVLRRTEEVELPQGIIVDLFASRADAETLKELLRHALRFFGSDVAAVSYGTSIAEFAALFRRRGFIRTRTHHPTCVCRDEELRGRLDQLRSDWFLSKGDHDWDLIHVADRAAPGE